MAITNGGPLRAPDTTVVFTPSTITVAVGETATINYSSATAPPSASTLDTLLGGIATTEVNGGGMVGTVVISGVSAGTASIAPSTPLGNGATMSQDGFALTVTAPVEDDKFLNKRGLTHFWENIDEIKQDKLIAGTNITIASDNTISASQPTVNDATLTIQRNGTNVQTFTANASSNVTANISVPTKTSDLTNDGSDNTAQYLETDETAYKTASIPYGQCDSTSTSTVFTATVPGVTELRDGVCMWLKNGVVTSASGFTININNLGAKPVYNNMAAATRDTTIWNINYTMFFVYDSTRVEGGCWMLYRGYNSDTNTIGYQLRTNSTSLTTTDRTRYYRLLFTSADNTHWVPANTQYDNSATSNKTINQRKINPFGRIVYLGNSTSYLADAAVSATAVWDQYAFNLGYSFSKGSALTMTFPKPVYIKCAPQSDGSAIIDSTNPYVQDLPSTDDGKIYIYLGIAYSATNVEMVINHPVYYYKDGAIREWTNAVAVGGGPTVVQTTGQSTADVMSQKAVTDELGAKADSSSLATVATSGSYDDLSNKPTIPTVNNATLTIQKNGTTVNTFTANASSDVTANITVPINVSELTNDAGYITSYTDNKTAQTLTRPTTSTTYYPVASASSSTNTADVKKFSGVSLSYFDNEGGAATLTLGYTSLNGSVAGLISLVDSVGALGRTVIAGSGKTSTGNHTLNTPDTSGRLVANSSSDSATGSATNPVYADSDGVLHATTYTLEKSVPSDAVFTDTTYSNATTSTAGLMSAADKIKLNGIATGAEVNVQSDWNVTDTASDAFIKNKPTLATVATSGSYDDLSGKPTIPAAQVQSDWAQTTVTAVDYIKNKPTLSTVATSGSYDDLSDKPTIPAAQVNSDWNANSGVAQILNKPTFATVATSGSYNDLSNKPTIPTVNDATLTIQQNGTDVQTFTANQSTNATANITVPTATSDLANDGASGSSTYVEADELATVATTGDYADLSGAPTIPTVNDALLTITQKGSTLGTFTANASSAKTINITAPYCDGLYGQAQTAAYHRSVIALCEVTTTAQSSSNSWFCGRIAFHRDNGLFGVEVVNINMENQYYKAYYTNVSYYSNFTVLGSTASKDTAIGWRPCTFKYNNVYYGGIEICTNIANHNIIWYETIGNFTPFGVDYYSMSHGSTASSVLNSEINDSISFTQWDEAYNQWHVGRATRDIIYDNASGTNGNFSTTTAMSSYDEVEICYRDGNYNYALKRIPGAAGNFVLDIAHPGGSSTVQWYVSRWSVSGVNATASATCMRKAIASTSVSTYTEKDIYITRITGIRY